MHKRKQKRHRKAKKRTALQELFLSFAILSIVSLPALAIGFTTSIDRTSELNADMVRTKHHHHRLAAYSKHKNHNRVPASQRLLNW